MKSYLNDDEIKAAYVRWCKGERPAQIAESMFVSESTIWRGLRKLGLKKQQKSSKKCDSDKPKDMDL